MIAVSIVNNETPEIHTLYSVEKTSVHVGSSNPFPSEKGSPANESPAGRSSSASKDAREPHRSPPKVEAPPPSAQEKPAPEAAAHEQDPPVLQFSKGLTSSLGARRFSPITAIAIATGTAVLIGLGLLFTRLRRDQVLEHPMRRAIYDAICKEPGIRVGTLATRLGVNHRTVQHHVDALVGFSLVRMQVRQLLPIGLLSPPEEARYTGLLANSRARKVYDFLLAHGPQDLKQIATGIGLAYTTVSATTVQLRKAGLATRKREWRRWVLEAVPANVGAKPRVREAEFVWNLDALPNGAKPTNP